MYCKPTNGKKNDHDGNKFQLYRGGQLCYFQDNRQYICIVDIKLIDFKDT
jgi:hypothetical protein